MSGVVLGAGVGALVALLLGALGQKVTAEVQKNGDTIIFDESGNKIARVQGEAVPFNFMEWLPQRISAIVVTTRPAKAQFVFDNPLKQDVKLLNLSFVPDTNFKTKGVIIVLVNGTELVPETAVGTFTDPSDFAVPIPRGGLTLRRDEKVEIFIWSPDATAIALTAAPLFGAVV